jgi:hypothetical protein
MGVIDPDTLLNVTIKHAAFTYASERIEMAQARKNKREEPVCLALLGESGAGKSFLIDYLEYNNLRVETDDGMVIPLVRASVPSKPTIKNVAEEILSKLDPDDPRRSYTESQITKRIEDLMDECDTDVIVLEEFQHFYDRTTETVWEHAADWLKRLIEVKKKKNHTRRMLVVSGLKQSMDVILQNSQLRRRFKAPLFLPCFSWRDPKQRAEFAACYNGFEDVIKKHFSMPDVKENKMYFRCYCATGGLIGYLKALLHEVVEYAIKSNKKELGLKDFDAAFDRFLFSNREIKITYRPFNESFSTTPTDDILNQAFLIGTPPVPEVARRRKRALSAPSCGNSFVAKGLENRTD